MTDIRKQFYHTRVQLYCATLSSLPNECVIAFLPRKSVYILKTLMRYAHRRIQWVQEILNESEFLAPNDENWNDIQALLDETEGCLMETCDVCQIVDALQCICNALRLDLGNTIAPLATMRDDAVESAFEYSRTLPDREYTGISDENACIDAQLFYALGYETITEIVLPASRFAFDTLVPAVAALIITVTGGIALPAALGVYLTAELIQELLESGYDASESNLENWILSVKEEIVCSAYYALLAEHTAKQVADIVYNEVIAPTSSISALDKLVCKLFFSSWTVTNASIAREQSTTWASENYETGYCDTCEITGDHIWLFPPCPNGWTGNGVGCCSDNTIRLRQVFSAWMNNRSASIGEISAGQYNVTYQCMLYVDFGLWDFPPGAGDRLIRFTMVNLDTSQFEAQIDVLAGEVSSPGWNYIRRTVEDATFDKTDERALTCSHEDTNALCVGIRISALAVTLELIG